MRRISSVLATSTSVIGLVPRRGRRCKWARTVVVIADPASVLACEDDAGQRGQRTKPRPTSWGEVPPGQARVGGRDGNQGRGATPAVHAVERDIARHGGRCRSPARSSRDNAGEAPHQADHSRSGTTVMMSPVSNSPRSDGDDQAEVEGQSCRVAVRKPPAATPGSARPWVAARSARSWKVTDQPCRINQSAAPDPRPPFHKQV